ncbi:MAG: hypothetical protein HZB75_00835 [Candidatus Saccharibacteria bacterium]|nr:MAG: hypothetical protein HZB75_00835 [Candidatus Saccharibacteria bacterium]
MMKRKTLTASMLRLYLSLSLFAITLLAGGALYFINEQLRAYAGEVSKVTAEANSSQNNVQALQKVQEELEKNKEVKERARNIVADNQSYQYQNQIITDLNGYAKKAGVTITNIDFSAGSTATPTTPSTPKSGTTTTPAAPSGVKSTSASITLKNPVSYTRLLRFIKSIEDNLTKMQISRVGLARGTDNQITSEALSIEVYIR